MARADLSRASYPRWLTVFAAGAVITALGGIVYLLQPDAPAVATVDLPLVDSGGPPMCPWREPKRDLQRFFPSATDYRTDTLALSSIRQPILDRLGPGGRIESNSLYAHRALQNGKTVGSVLVRRAPGPHGAVEMVMAVDLTGKVVGVHLQRHREPPAVAQFLLSPSFLERFRGITAESDPRTVHADLGDANKREAAQAITGMLRTMLIEFEEAERHYGDASGRHH